MKALAVCPTYGRLPYLGRMLSSFMEQTYDDKHLVVINDDKNIQILCDDKNVTVINCNKRISIGEKRNIGIALGHYDVIFPWDDDDIFLPHRIANHMEQYKDKDVRAYRNFSSYILLNNTFTSSNGGLNSLSYLKDEWFAVGGYKSKLLCGEDAELYNKLNGFKTERNDNKRDFVYCFSTSNYHASSNNPKNIEEVAHEQLEKMNLVGKKFYINGDIEEYNKYVNLHFLFEKRKKDLMIKHLGDGKIDITHLL